MRATSTGCRYNAICEIGYWPAADMSGDSWRAVEISVRCGDVTHRWAAQQCLIRMVRLQWIALLATSRQAWGKALLLHLVKRRSTCGSERSNDSSTRDVRLLEQPQLSRRKH